MLQRRIAMLAKFAATMTYCRTARKYGFKQVAVMAFDSGYDALRAL